MAEVTAVMKTSTGNQSRSGGNGTNRGGGGGGGTTFGGTGGKGVVIVRWSLSLEKHYK